MKRLFAFFFSSLIATVVLAQNGPVGVRMEYASVSEDDWEYTLFSYPESDGTLGYYLGVSVEFNLLEVFRDDIKDMSFGHIDEVCVWMGSNRAEVMESIDKMLSWYDAEVGTIFPLKARGVNGGGETLDGPMKADCILVKRIFSGRRLCFNFVSGNHTARADLKKGALKTLKHLFSVEGRLHGEEE